MDITFRDPELARICNSARAIEAKAGPELGRLLERRLWDVAACDEAGLAQLPDTIVRSTSEGRIDLQFGDALILRGVITQQEGPSGDEEILITRIAINGSELR